MSMFGLDFFRGGQAKEGDSVFPMSRRFLEQLRLLEDVLSYQTRVIKSLDDQGVAADPELVELTERVRKVLDVIDGKEAK